MDGDGSLKAKLFGLLLLVSILATSCGGGDSGKMLTISDAGWTENTAISGLTKVLLEEKLGYEKVTIRTDSLNSMFDRVSNGDLDAFQDVWLPNQRNLLSSVQDNVELLDPWYRGQTKQGIAVPAYMNTMSLDQLNESNADLIYGIEPSSVVMKQVFDEVIPAYGLRAQLVEGSTDGMLARVDNLYRNGEEFAFLAWSPHWMNQRYDIRYLEDPKNAFGELNNAAQVSTIVKENLKDADPVAYAFMKALSLDEDQLNDLEDTINEVGDPLEGARQWAAANPDIVQSWLDAAENAQQPA